VIDAIDACLIWRRRHQSTEEGSSMSGFQLHRLGQIMEPEPANAQEA
jgi:hypothetical protein